MVQVDLHIYATLTSSRAALRLVELMPENDLALELATLLNVQYSILHNWACGKHFGTENLEEFINYANEKEYEAHRISNNAN